MAKNIGYLRVSKKEENLENQRNAISNFTNEDLVFFEDTISGSIPALQRKAFRDLFEYAEKMHPEKIYVYEISRLGFTHEDASQDFRIRHALSCVDLFFPL